jgi:hypothetical protein
LAREHANDERLSEEERDHMRQVESYLVDEQRLETGL